MPLINYDYLARPSLYKKKLIVIYRPIISIRMSANNKLFPNVINCVVDSGADFNLLPAWIGESIGLNIRKGEKITHMGIANVGIVAYSHPVKIYLDGYNFKTDIHFSYDHRIPILGRHGFFKFFKRVTFNEKDLRLELEH